MQLRVTTHEAAKVMLCNLFYNLKIVCTCYAAFIKVSPYRGNIG